MAKKILKSEDDFRSFIRDVGVRSFNQLAARYDKEPPAGEEQTRRGAALARLARLWAEMAPEDKENFFDQMIVTAETAAAAGPAMIGIDSLKKKKKKDREDENPAGEGRKKKKKKKKSKESASADQAATETAASDSSSDAPGATEKTDKKKKKKKKKAKRK